jgi:hypothetical protein
VPAFGQILQTVQFPARFFEDLLAVSPVPLRLFGVPRQDLPVTGFAVPDDDLLDPA